MSGARWIPVVLWAGFILTATSLPTVPAPPAPLGTDKLAHVAMYAVLGVLALRAARQTAPMPRTVLVTLAAIALQAQNATSRHRATALALLGWAIFLALTAGVVWSALTFGAARLERLEVA